jgi:hypothetical protein
MVILWLFYGDFMVILWLFYGDFMVILWWFYGDFQFDYVKILLIFLFPLI